LNEREALRDRYRGALLAAAAGDALGATLEFMSPAAIQREHGQLRDIIGGGWLKVAPGEITDDTQMALCIARSLAERGAFEADDIAARFVAWHASKPKDIGNTTAHALEQLARGVPWEQAGQRTHEAMRPRDASNGSIMRCAPIALYARADPARIAQISADASRITHANPLCVAASVALNAAIAALLTDPTADPLTVALAATDDETLRAALAAVPNLTPAELPASGYVLDTLQAAFWAVIQHATLEEAIIAGVNLGNDSDTTGAVAGALAGARWGMAAIPERWLNVLQPRAELTQLADKLLELAG
jgi:ADP-ribosyl-[dinitrogen reductase] hydrolase